MNSPQHFYSHKDSSVVLRLLRFDVMWVFWSNLKDICLYLWEDTCNQGVRFPWAMQKGCSTGGEIPVSHLDRSVKGNISSHGWEWMLCGRCACYLWRHCDRAESRWGWGYRSSKKAGMISHEKTTRDAALPVEKIRGTYKPCASIWDEAFWGFLHWPRISRMSQSIDKE